MIDEATLRQINGEYQMPPGAGPAWRAAYEMGMDMSLIEDNLEMTDWERFRQNDRVLALVREIRRCNPLPEGFADGFADRID